MSRGGTAVHGSQRRHEIDGDTRRHAGMNADCGKEIRVRLPEDHRHGPARRHSGNVDARRVDAMLGHHVTGHARNQRRLSAIGVLVSFLVPVPATVDVGHLALFGIQHDAAALFRQLVHAGSGRKVRGVLAAAVQHHKQRRRLAIARSGHVELVVADTGSIEIRTVDQILHDFNLG